ncbi:HAD-IA family hydrolase [Bacillus sp. NTK071]|uniref:HAD family hydrolase n=1 Tax=Bacillus sp. NTK071 TaxID=2802175 RepID=UPI001A8E1749|nr:HAD-IA family hydrolase [Bacillus sp. NTK071]MBN8209790.1 HAD-IA family hydrolase [Bacillus sp. NTK071]
MVKAVIFDLDDTLISEYQYIESGYSHVSQLLSNQFQEDSMEIKLILMELFHECPQNVFNRLYERLERTYTNEMITDLVQEYRNHDPVIAYYSDVLPCLLALKNKGIKMGIITNGYANAQKQKLRAVGRLEFFDEIILTDEIGSEYWKPHAKAYEMMKNRLKLDYGEMVYVGDNVSKDFVAPNKLGMKTVHIEREKGIYQGADVSYGLEFQAQYAIKSLWELMALFE